MDDLTESFIDLDGFESSSDAQSYESADLMSQMLDFGDSPLAPPSLKENPASHSVQNLNTLIQTGMSSHLSSILSSLIALSGRILQELHAQEGRLLSLNPSRRDAVAAHLNRLAGALTTSPSGTHHPKKADATLQQWLEGPRGAVHEAALSIYFEEVTLLALGQAIVLKNWSDRGISKWTEQDLGRLNWAMSTALKSHIPLDREGWQITRPNLYSWYSLSPTLQREAWSFFDGWKIEEEGPSFLMTLCGPVRRAHTVELVEMNSPIYPQGYDPRFFESLWGAGNVSQSSESPTLLKRQKIAFSPTLRDGSMVRTSPREWKWIGLESSPFQLMMAELMQMWWEPSAPSIWSVGSGLEVHPRDQLALNWVTSKPSALCRMTEMEACDFGLVLEEQTIRSQGKSGNSVRFKEQLESLPYFKGMRSAGTTLGGLQACVALTKLRPGGALWWAREEALSTKDGSGMLNFLLDRAKLVCEWDFSEVEHSLPSSLPLFPKHLYYFEKESKLEVRLNHRPARYSIQGQLRSHVELSLLLEDSLQLTHQKPGENSIMRGQWTVAAQTSPYPQKNWLEKWPDPTCHSTLRALERLRTHSIPLAHFTTIRPTFDPDTHGNWSIAQSLLGFWIESDCSSDERRLLVHPLPGETHPARGEGFLILVSNEEWIAPLKAFLLSKTVKDWLDCHAERKGEKWVLNEQIVRWLPIPKSLLQLLNIAHASSQPQPPLSWSRLLPLEWESLVACVGERPKDVLSAMNRLKSQEELENLAVNFLIQASVFVQTARVIEQFYVENRLLFSFVGPDGRIRWREFLHIHPKSECCPMTLHPKIRLSGTLPPHLPIERFDRTKVTAKSAEPAVLFATQNGFTLQVSSESSLLITMIMDQLSELVHPTWSELTQYLILPRRTEFAESTALDVLRSHSEQISRLQEYQDIISNCRLF